jgi:hypothetical protein
LSLGTKASAGVAHVQNPQNRSHVATNVRGVALQLLEGRSDGRRTARSLELGDYESISPLFDDDVDGTVVRFLRPKPWLWGTEPSGEQVAALRDGCAFVETHRYLRILAHLSAQTTGVI